MEIPRDIYLEKLIQKKGNGLVKIISGIRRCGKSYLMNEIFYRHLIEEGVPEDHIVRFGFDSATDLHQIGEDLLELKREKRLVDPQKFIKFVSSKLIDDNSYYLLLDEVQLLESFEAVLNGYLRKRNLDIYVSRSNARFLTKDIITEFAGRGDEIRMQPLNFSEFMTVFDGDKNEGLQQFMLLGGIPNVVLSSSNEERTHLLDNLFTEIYLKDIKQRYNLKNTYELEQLLNILSSSIGSLTNPEKLKNRFASELKSTISATTIKKYLEILQDSFLIYRVNRYDLKGKSYIGTPSKFYYSDLGLRNSNINFRQIEPSHSLENIIYNELILRGFNVDVGVVPTAVKNFNNRVNRAQLEVDFVCNLGFKRCYIQSAFALPDQDKINQETRPLTKIDDSFKKIIITADMTPKHYDENGILFMSIFDFLLNKNSLEEV